MLEQGMPILVTFASPVPCMVPGLKLKPVESGREKENKLINQWNGLKISHWLYVVSGEWKKI